MSSSCLKRFVSVSFLPPSPPLPLLPPSLPPSLCLLPSMLETPNMRKYSEGLLLAYPL